MTATLDTAFHRTMPEKAFRYAIPSELVDKHGTRRYAFHGLAHRYITERYAAISGSRQEKAARLDGDRSAEGVIY